MACYNVLFALLFSLICMDKYIEGASFEPKRYDLIHYLLNKEGYDPTLPPNFYTDSTTNVFVQMSIYDLNYESDLNMEFECTLYLRLNWTDPRLNFTANDTSYETLKVSSSNIGKVWIPDLYFHNERHAELHKLMSSNELIYIHRNGNIRFSCRINIKIQCDMDLNDYPYDEQQCQLFIQSYAFTAEDIILHWGVPPVIVKTNNLSVVPNSSTSTVSPPYLDPVGNFSTLTTTIKFKRGNASYEVMYIGPTVVLSVLSLTSFFLGDDVTRVNIAIGSLTPLMVQWAAIYNKLPAVSTLYKLDWWMLANTIFVGGVVLANVIIYRIRICCKPQDKSIEIKDFARDRQPHDERIEMMDLARNRPGDNVEADGRLGQNQGDNAEAGGRLWQNQGDNAVADGRLGQNQGDNAVADGRLGQNQGDNAEADGRLGQNRGDNVAAVGRPIHNQRDNVAVAADGRPMHNQKRCCCCKQIKERCCFCKLIQKTCPLCCSCCLDIFVFGLFSGSYAVAAFVIICEKWKRNDDQ